MRVHSIAKIKELKKLRRRGYSINELVKKTSIPKTTVWHHIHNIQVLRKYIPILNAKRGGSAKRTENNWEKARVRAKELLRSPNRESLIAIAMLYWGEGSKKVCEFINSDGRMVNLYLTILRKVFGIAEDNLKITIRIFSGMERMTCLSYWSKITKMPQKKFVVRFNDGGTKGRTAYGMCRITVKKGSNVLKLIHSLIEQIPKEIIMNI